MRAAKSLGGWGLGVCLAAAMVVAPGCRREQTPVAPEVGTGLALRPPPARRAEGGTIAVAVANSPVQLLPDTTVAVGQVAGIREVLAVVDIDAIIGKYRTYYDQAAQAVVAGAGFNLLDPGQWREVGIDPDGPMGAALLDPRSETYAGFITISDRDKFRALLDRVGGSRRLQPVLEDRGLVLKSDPDDSSALVLRDGFAFYVVTGRVSQAPYDFARLLATIDPARGLTATPRYQRAVAGGAPGATLSAYVDLWAIVQAEQAAREARRVDPEPSWPEQELRRAIESGAPAEEQNRLRQQADEQRAWEQQYAERQQREFAAWSRWLGSVEPIVFEFTGDLRGVTGKIRARMPETAPLRAVLRNAAAPSPVFAALGERPIMMLGGSVDVAAALVSFEELLRADGEDPEKGYAELRERVKIDFKGEVLPVLTGSAGFALTISEAGLRGETKDWQGFALAVGVKDNAAAQALLDRAALKLAKAVGSPLGRDAKSGAHTLAFPGYRTVYAAVVAGQLVVTTDAGVVRRVATGAGSTRLLDAAVVPVMTARDVAVQGLVDVILPTFMVSAASFDASEYALAQPYGQFPEVEQAKIDRVPQSRAYKAKLRDWEAIGAKILREDLARQRRQMQVVVALSECVGVMAGNLREQSDGLELAGGQYFGKGGLTRAIDLGVEYFTAQRGMERTYELYSERSAVEEDLRRIRISDVAAALHQPTPVQ